MGIKIESKLQTKSATRAIWRMLQKQMTATTRSHWLWPPANFYCRFRYVGSEQFSIHLLLSLPPHLRSVLLLCWFCLVHWKAPTLFPQISMMQFIRFVFLRSFTLSISFVMVLILNSSRWHWIESFSFACCWLNVKALLRRTQNSSYLRCQALCTFLWSFCMHQLCRKYHQREFRFFFFLRWFYAFATLFMRLN